MSRLVSALLAVYPFLATVCASLAFFGLVLREIKRHAPKGQRGIVSSRIATFSRILLGAGAVFSLLMGWQELSAHLYLSGASISLLDYPVLRITFRNKKLCATTTRLQVSTSTDRPLATLMLLGLALREIYLERQGDRASARAEPVASPVMILAYLLADTAISAFPQIVATDSSSTAYQQAAGTLALLAILMAYWPVFFQQTTVENPPLGLEALCARLSACFGSCDVCRLLAEEAFGRGWVTALMSATLIASLLINGLGRIFVSIPSFWYANCISICNFLCGFSGLVICALSHQNTYELSLLVVCLILVGQFLDLFDGRAADRWGSTPHGEVFDDIADGTSFGLCMGLLVYRTIRNALFTLLGVDVAESASVGEIVFSGGLKDPRTLASIFSAFVALAYAACIIFRLVRFILNKRALKTDGGVCFFVGLPSPGTAACVGMLCILLARSSSGVGAEAPQSRALALQTAGTVIVIAGLSWLTISSVPYAHFGRVFNHPGRSSPALRAAMSSSLVVSLLYALLFRSPQAFLIWFGTGAVLYLLTPLYADRLGLYKEVREEHAAVVEMTATLKRDKKRKREERREARRARRASHPHGLRGGSRAKPRKLPGAAEQTGQAEGVDNAACEAIPEPGEGRDGEPGLPPQDSPPEECPADPDAGIEPPSEQAAADSEADGEDGDDDSSSSENDSAMDSE